LKEGKLGSTVAAGEQEAHNRRFFCLALLLARLPKRIEQMLHTKISLTKLNLTPCELVMELRRGN